MYSHDAQSLRNMTRKRLSTACQHVMAADCLKPGLIVNLFIICLEVKLTLNTLTNVCTAKVLPDKNHRMMLIRKSYQYISHS